MGIDIHSLQLLKHNQKNNGALGKTLTLGRLSVILGPKLLKKWTLTDQGAWGDDLLIKHFGATEVDSIDKSNYEGAKIIWDYNLPVPQELHHSYDAILDFGCSEHIFNVSQSFKNTADLCKVGGNILHILPADNFCGHGFYQFTPEFFFSIYSEENGFKNTEIYLSETLDFRSWYQIQMPKNGERLNLRSDSELYIIVSTRKYKIKNMDVQQSDYTHIWNENVAAKVLPYRPGKLMALQEIFSFSPYLLKLLMRLNNIFAPQGARKLSWHKNLMKFTPPEV